MNRILMVGSAEQSGGGVASVIRLMKRMPFWKERRCGWLGTQIQAGYGTKLWYALRAYVVALFTIWRYGIVHFHTVPDKICLVIQMPVLFLAKLARKKVILHIHMGNQLEDHTGNRLFLWCLRRADRVVLLARKWQNLFAELYPSVKVPTAVIYNACESDVAVDGSRKEKLIIMAAHLDENKRPDLLLRAWHNLRSEFPDWRVIIMGNGDVPRYEQLANELGLQDSVRFTGYITGREKEDIWERASIYAMCSRHEGFPMVVLEAWTRGVSVVTTPVGGLPDVIDEGKNCLTFPFGSEDGLTRQLRRLMSDKSLRETLAKGGRQTIPQFSPEQVNRDIEHLYTEL